MKSIQNIEEEIVEEFSMFDSWIDKYDYLIDLGKSLDILKAVSYTHLTLPTKA